MNATEEVGYDYYNDDQPTNNSVEQTGHTNGLEKRKTFLNNNYEFRYNVLNGRVEYRKKDIGSEFNILDNRGENDIILHLSSVKMSTRPQTLNMLLNSDFVPFYNPIKEYLESLPE